MSTPSVPMHSPQSAVSTFDLVNESSAYSSGSSNQLLATLTVKSRALRYDFTLPAEYVAQLDNQRAQFHESISRQEEENAGHEIKSEAALAFKFVDFVLGCSSVSTPILRLLASQTRGAFLQQQDIHGLVCRLPDGPAVRREVLTAHARISVALSSSLCTAPSALASAAQSGDASVLMAFRGQGPMNSACVDELADLYSLYRPLVAPLVSTLSRLLERLSRHPDTRSFYLGREVDLEAWLADAGSRPHKDFVASCAVSFPIIGVLDLMHYCAIGQMLDKTPGQTGKLLSGVTGHSQGLVVAAAIAQSTDSDSWESFINAQGAWAVEVLFWMGYESHTTAPHAPLSPAAARRHVEDGHGHPSHLLLVRGLQGPQVQDLLDLCNRQRPPTSHIHLALHNGARNYVLAGTPQTLDDAVLRLQDACARDDEDQSRIPFSRRKPVAVAQFLPVSAPFHSDLLLPAADRLRSRFSDASSEQALSRRVRTVGDLQMPVFHTETGQSLCDAYEASANLAHVLIDAVTLRAVDWPRALQAHAAPEDRPSHIIVLGGDRFADLAQQNVDGLGVRVLNGASLRFDAEESSEHVHGPGTKQELFAHDLTLRQLSPRSDAWELSYQPWLVRGPGHRFQLKTRLSRILNAPPFITAGMTPTTVSWDFVAAVMNSGHHIELAGGGYRDAKTMGAAIEKLAANIPRGRGITCNLIYVDPRAMSFQVPLLRDLMSRGVPIEGLTIGAGVPSLEVVSGYIQTLPGLRHISLKPGTAAGIREVVSIARAHPSFPIILQWTGGRGGGHHSCEDFHEPLLATYADIRRCENLYLVVGSGFGDGSGIYPYLTGEWASSRFGRPAMPVDGILLGSRMMVAREAHTSPQVKELLVKAPGVDDGQWETSYQHHQDSQGGDGNEYPGVLTVTSEMGQPIHKLATRGVRLWKDLDETIFKLPRADRTAALVKRKAEIIRRLNADFAKPWFGVASSGHPVDLQDMNYIQVLARLVQLMYIAHQKRWVDPSYRDLVRQFGDMTWERVGRGGSEGWDTAWLDEEPERMAARFAAACPDAAAQLLHPEDESRLVSLCKERGRKPVNFIVALDADFETSFKKDSLWQSEDIDAVVGQDPERVCILQSPVAVRYAARHDQSAGEILDQIEDETVAFLRKETNTDQGPCRPRVEIRDQDAVDATRGEERLDIPQSITVDCRESHIVFRPSNPNTELPDREDWLRCVGRNTTAGIAALFNEEYVFVGQDTNSRQANMFRRIFTARRGFSVHLGREKAEALLIDDQDNRIVVHVVEDSEQHVQIELYHRHEDGRTGLPATLKLEWEFSGGRLVDCTGEVVRHRRIQEFYAQLWTEKRDQTGSESVPGALTDTFHGSRKMLHQDLFETMHTVVSHAFPEASSPSSGRGGVMPIESAVIAAWEVLMKPLLHADLRGADLLRLVHQSIDIAYAPNASPLQVNDAVVSHSRVRSVTIKPTGKAVSVEALLARDEQHIATVSSDFFIKGSFSDYSSTFQDRDEPDVQLEVTSAVHEAVLRSLDWLQLDVLPPDEPLVGKTLRFRLNTVTRWTDSSACASIATRGTVHEQRWDGSARLVGRVVFVARDGSRGNPVLDYLARAGSPMAGGRAAAVPLARPGGAAERRVAIPAGAEHSRLYAAVSGDANPIHTSRVFAAVAGLPADAPIVHGMYTAAVCRRAVEELVVDGEAARLRALRVSFVGIVHAGDQLAVRIRHEAMREGRMVLRVTARNVATGEVVIEGEADVEQPKTVYLFTGQGTQSKGMGMSLYESSPVAKRLWDKMDTFLFDKYGWSILDIIRNNPKELTIHFRGPHGRKILQNYLSMTKQIRPTLASSPQDYKDVPIIPDLTLESTSYTFHDSRGLIHATQFAQPAIILLENATLEDMKAKAVIQQGAGFAGHSLGEYGALSSMAGFVPLPSMLSICFYRGLMMQFAMQRDAHSPTGYSMVAASPSRVGKYFDENSLRVLVDTISQQSGQLLEIVNFNLQGEQYVCAGHVRNIYCLTELLDLLAKHPPSSAEDMLRDFTRDQDDESARTATTILGGHLARIVSQSRSLPLDVQLRRGRATIPLDGIDVPFHSALLRPGIEAYRSFLGDNISVENIYPERLVGRFIPNVVGRPFSVQMPFLRIVADRTQSRVLGDLIREIEAVA